MATNIEMNIKQTDGTYNPLYPSTVASQVSGTFAASQIPNLATSKITSGTFDTARIPNLEASKITSGTFATGRIPTLPASQISAGTFQGTKTSEYVFPGHLRIGGTGSSSDARLRIGDSDYVYLHEYADDCLDIYAKTTLNLKTLNNQGTITLNGTTIGGSSGVKVLSGTRNGTGAYSSGTNWNIYVGFQPKIFMYYEIDYGGISNVAVSGNTSNSMGYVGGWSGFCLYPNLSTSSSKQSSSAITVKETANTLKVAKTTLYAYYSSNYVYMSLNANLAGADPKEALDVLNASGYTYGWTAIG